ncbi:MAG: glycosyl hydrolase [Proteobacteria bacterium]|nr:glycosyl hydrolase [Pseudomonadota bacterium]
MKKYITCLSFCIIAMCAGCADVSNDSQCEKDTVLCKADPDGNQILNQCVDGTWKTITCQGDTPICSTVQKACIADESSANSCGNGKCEDDETCVSCLKDCGACNSDYCGDGNCNAEETCTSCQKDCGECEITDTCGNGQCDDIEDCDTCEIDCGSCDTEPIAPSLKSFSGDQLYDLLGAYIVDKGVNFAVFAEHATRVELLIFDSKNPDTDQPQRRIPMTKDETSGIWTRFVHDIGVGTHYGYIAFGPNWEYTDQFYPNSANGYITDCDDQGNRYNPNKLLIDPYARRIHRDFDWNSGIPYSGVARDVSTWKAAPKSVIIKSEYQWSQNEKTWRENRKKGDAFAGHAASDMIYYEIHPKGFTAKAPDVNNPGTWKGVGERAQYLADLGITAVELMPVAEKNDDGTYWGYNTIAFFAPEQRYATSINQNKNNGVHDEFKEMVDKLHQAGIEVILDVAYNHTGEGAFLKKSVGFNYEQYNNFDDPTAASIYSWRGLDNKAYYHLLSDSSKKPNQTYLNETGYGNQMRTNYKPFRRFIIDNLRFWVEEMHVDGFRFELASILGVDDAKVRPEGDTSSGDNAYWQKNIANTVVQDIINDEVLQKYNTRFIAEAWSLNQYVNGLFPKATNKDNYAWYEWNGRFRDMIRALVNNDSYPLSSTETRAPNWTKDITLGNILTGSSKMFQEFGDNRKPYHSVNYITAHDGFTLYDLNTYAKEVNGCSSINPICCDSAYMSSCDISSNESDNVSRNWCAESGNNGYGSDGRCEKKEKEALKRQMIRNAFALLMISHGSPMILGGDEYMRTQFGNTNAYPDSADNEYNWFRWGDWLSMDDKVRMHDFVRSLIQIRKKYKVHLSPSEYNNTFQWWYPQGMTEQTAWEGRSIAMYYPKNNSTPELFVIINMDANSEKTFSLPDGNWKVLMDTQSYYDFDIFTKDTSLDTKKSQNINLNGMNTVSKNYTSKPRTIVILSK